MRSPGPGTAHRRGDAFCAAFASAPAALETALAAQRELDEALDDSGAVSRVRIALHTGHAESRDGDYFGRPLNRVARLLAIGLIPSSPEESRFILSCTLPCTSRPVRLLINAENGAQPQSLSSSRARSCPADGGARSSRPRSDPRESLRGKTLPVHFAIGGDA